MNNKERYKMPVSVQILLFNENGEVLLLKRKKTGFGDSKYGFIGGHVEKGENIKKAIIREVNEEIGVEIAENDLEFRNIMNRKVNQDVEYIDFIFIAKKWKGNIRNMEPEKCSELKWCNPNKLPSNILDFEKYIIDNKEAYLDFGW